MNIYKLYVLRAHRENVLIYFLEKWCKKEKRKNKKSFCIKIAFVYFCFNCVSNAGRKDESEKHFFFLCSKCSELSCYFLCA